MWIIDRVNNLLWCHFTLLLEYLLYYIVVISKTQLKSLAKTADALNQITSILCNTTSTYSERKKALIAIGRTYDIETLKSAIAQSTLNKTQIEAILIANGLQGELLETTTAELAQITSTNTLSASQVGATTSTLGLGTAFKGLGIAIKNSVKSMLTWIRTTPAGALTAIATAIGSVLTVVNHLEQAEKRESDNAVELYEKSQDKINSNKEEAKSLEELIDKYKELKSKSNMDSDTREQIKNLQYDIVDLVGSEASSLDLVNGRLDEQLDKLKEITNEKSKQNVDDARDNYHKAVHASDVIVGDADKYGNDASIQWNGAESKQIHKVDGFEKMSYNDFVQFIQDSGFEDIFRKNKDENLLNMRFVVDTTGIDELEDKITRLKEFKEFLAENGLRDTELYQSINTAIDKYTKQGDYESSSASNLVDEVIKDLSKSNDELDNITVNSVKSFEEYRQKMIDEVQKDESIGKALADGTLSNEDIEMAVNNFMATIEQFSKWYEQGINTIKVKEILQDQFDEKIGELTLDELKIAAEHIEVDEGTLLSWDELIAKIKEFQGFMQNTESPLSSSITETIDQLNTQLKPAIDSLKSAYQDIFTTDDDGKPLFTLENVDLSMLDSVKSAIDELNENEELNIHIDYSEYENLARVLTDTSSTADDVHTAFNSFATEMLNSTTATDGMTKETAQLVEQMLESLGVTNAHEIVYDSLIAKTEALALEEQLLSSVGGDLTNVTSDKVLAFLEQAGASETTRAYLIKLIAEEQVFSNQDLDVSGKISKLQELAQAYGQTALAAKIAAQEKANEESHTVGSWSESDLQNFQKEWNDGLSSISIDFTPKADTSKSKSKSKGSDKKETDKWLEEYKKKLAELQNQLDKGKRKCPLL